MFGEYGARASAPVFIPNADYATNMMPTESMAGTTAAGVAVADMSMTVPGMPLASGGNNMVLPSSSTTNGAPAALAGSGAPGTLNYGAAAASSPLLVPSMVPASPTVSSKQRCEEFGLTSYIIRIQLCYFYFSLSSSVSRKRKASAVVSSGSIIAQPVTPAAIVVDGGSPSICVLTFFLRSSFFIIIIAPPAGPSEPLYCVCRNISYGAMVGCDNPNVRRGC